eukprot:TRINITY_DN31547_c1_g1_i1.p1 TRINITY_DN31547_c1_g1~~TRINITY_DN31547_c1_g1_i1.p1  ORF type:complete len:1007 (+),score=309.22 TRINITY_DN31547_c1_g1_i1:2185-5205(+)
MVNYSISSVVPRSLPMTMAVAVNTALMTLVRAGVFCTEPHRVPYAGKLTHCLFDKTGTITTDTLSLEGIMNASCLDLATGKVLQEKDQNNKTVATTDNLDRNGLTDVQHALPGGELVLGACHSIVSVEGQGLLGDPIEIAGLRSVGWTFEPADAIAKPSSVSAKKTALEVAKTDLSKFEERIKLTPPRDPKEAEKERKDKTELVTKAEEAVKEADKRDASHPVESVKILQRYRFLSKLQRSCTVVKLKARGSGSDRLASGMYALVKGSPEALRPLLEAGSEPAWYESRYRDLAESGMRVLALALKRLPDDLDVENLPPREEVESKLGFVGFIAFSCRIRGDSGLVITALKESAHRVALITGDSPLTALHVARQTGICKPDLPALVLQVDDDGEVSWAVATGEKRGTKKAFDPTGLKDLVEKENYELMTTETALRAAVEKDPVLWEQIENITVFARMAPQGKADVIRHLQKLDAKVLMCGDGGNDMGALKQADVGLALFSGYGNTNAETAEEAAAEMEEKKDTASQAIISSEDRLNQHQKDLQKHAKEMQKEKNKLFQQKQAELQAKQKQWLEEEMARREAAGLDMGFMAHAAAMKAVMSRFTKELYEERKKLDLKYGNVYDKKKDDPLAQLMGEVESGQGGGGDAAAAAAGMPVVRPGDASLAAAFTSRTPSIKNTVDLIRQGRCALLSALQQQQIVMLHCLINAYVLSALSLEGSRSSERQMMASSWLLNTASLAFSYARPCDKMHPVRPLKSLFHPAVFISLFGQATIHLGCLVYATSMAREAMDPDSQMRKDGYAVGPSLPDVADFWKKQKLIRQGVLAKEIAEEEDMSFVELAMKQWESPFLPNLMNTVVFLVETSQTVAVLAVNYKGQPWMKGLMENRPLFLSVFITIGALGATAWEAVPQANAMVHLTPFPGDDFRIRIMVLVIISIFGTFTWDRICVRYFAPDIYNAMWQAFASTTFEGDILPVIMDCGKIIFGFFLFCCGLPGWIGLFIWWKNRKKED